MPQLDKVTFYSQVFWLLITFFSLHYIFLKEVLPSIAASLKYRHHILNSYSKVRNELTSESSRITELQKNTISLPLTQMHNYVAVTNEYVETLMMRELSNSLYTSLYVSQSSTNLFDSLWDTHKLRLELKELNKI